MIPWWVLAAAAAAIMLLAGSMGEGSSVLSDFLATITGRGSRVGPRATPDALGVIRLDPQSLADAAGLDLETYALARMLSSEEGNSPKLYKVAAGWAAVNKAGGRIADVLLHGRGDTDGYFKAQNARYEDPDGTTHSAGVYASTAIDPYDDDVTIARVILGRTIEDPTQGATNFYSPRVQQVAYDSGKSGYTKDADAVDAEWRAGGLEKVEIDGIDPWELSFYRPARGA